MALKKKKKKKRSQVNMKSNHGERCQDPVTRPLSLWPQSLHELLAGRGRGSTGSGAVSGVGLSGPGWDLVSCESFGTLAELPFFFKKNFSICEIEPITPLSSSCYWCVDHNQNERAIWAFSKPRRVTDRACATMISPLWLCHSALRMERAPWEDKIKLIPWKIVSHL